MIGIVGKRDPLPDVVKGTNRFEKAIDDLARKFPRNPKSPSSGAHQLESLWHLLNNMQHHLRSLHRESKAHRVVSPLDASALSSSFESIMEELRWLSRKQVQEDPFPSRHPLFKKVIEEAGRLDRSLKNLAAATSWNNYFSDSEKDPLNDIPRRLSAAIRDLDKKAAKKISLEELEQWCSYFPPVVWKAPQTVPRVAKIYLLKLIPFQVWEVRYRSEAPGRPLVLAIATSDFPDLELLSWCDTTYGFRRNTILRPDIQVCGWFGEHPGMSSD